MRTLHELLSVVVWGGLWGGAMAWTMGRRSSIFTTALGTGASTFPLHCRHDRDIISTNSRIHWCHLCLNPSIGGYGSLEVRSACKAYVLSHLSAR
jgi:hypothetical protein